ncbi:MAG: amidohydrolase family protein, partial [Candidatus Promineifilaceae bacterium]
GMVYDGSGKEGFKGDVAIEGDRIAAVGRVPERAPVEIDAAGLAVSPGFINMMCWANESLIEDGRSQSDIRQGVTLEILGEGWSMGPLNDEMKAQMKARQSDIQYEIEWTTLGEYLAYLVQRGVSCNVASFVGAGGVRGHVIGYEDRRPTAAELVRMQDLVRQAMAEGAVGVSSALIYSPDSFADTEELVALASAAAAYDGIYITHLRSEGAKYFEALDEFMEIVGRSGARGEIYHLKASGHRNWPKLDEVIRRVEAAQQEGMAITADMYTYHASATGLDSIMPAWVQEGGHEAWVARLKDPVVRERLLAELSYEGDDMENGYLEVSSPDGILLTSLRNPDLRYLTGKTLAEVAAMREKSPLEVAFDLVVEDDSRVGAVFFTMSEENVRKKLALPWVSYCSDSASLAPEGVFLNSNPHPRAYGSFARLLGKYVREEGIIPLEEAVRRLAALPADVLKLRQRGRLKAGYFADLAIFDPKTIRDNATFAKPHQYATGMVHVLVNGVPVLTKGEHTGKMAGRVVKGPGAVSGD